MTNNYEREGINKVEKVIKKVMLSVLSLFLVAMLASGGVLAQESLLQQVEGYEIRNEKRDDENVYEIISTNESGSFDELVNEFMDLLEVAWEIARGGSEPYVTSGWGGFLQRLGFAEEVYERLISPETASSVQEREVKNGIHDLHIGMNFLDFIASKEAMEEFEKAFDDIRIAMVEIGTGDDYSFASFLRLHYLFLEAEWTWDVYRLKEGSEIGERWLVIVLEEIQGAMERLGTEPNHLISLGATLREAWTLVSKTLSGNQSTYTMESWDVFSKVFWETFNIYSSDYHGWGNLSSQEVKRHINTLSQALDGLIPLASLTNLTVSHGNLSPSFSHSVFNYTVGVGNGVSSIIINATANDGAVVSGTGAHNLQMGRNPITLTVKAGEVTQIYTIVVTRAAASPPPPSGGDVLPQPTVPLWRMYNEGINQHLWTTCENEYNVLADYGWRQEGIAWHTPTTGRPVHRLFHEGIIRHHYTADQNEVRVLRERGWNDEGVLFFCADPNVGPNEGIRMTRLYHEDALKHLHTADAHEVHVLTTQHGWRNEGESFVGLPAR